MDGHVNGGSRFAPTANRAPRWTQNLVAYQTWRRYGYTPGADMDNPHLCFWCVSLGNCACANTSEGDASTMNSVVTGRSQR